MFDLVCSENIMFREIIIIMLWIRCPCLYCAWWYDWDYGDVVIIDLYVVYWFNLDQYAQYNKQENIIKYMNYQYWR